jgi:hypothetical protein
MNNCFLLSCFISMAYNCANYIKDYIFVTKFESNPIGSYIVRLFDDGVPRLVTLDDTIYGKSYE